MSTATLFQCDKCKSVEQTQEYRLDPKNFYQYTFSTYAIGGGGPMMPGATGTNRNETFQICAECKSALDADIDAIVTPLKAS